MATEETMIFWW